MSKAGTKIHPKKKPNKVADDSWLHCCQYCHYFSQGECLHPSMLGDDAKYSDWFESACEDGIVQETLEEEMMTEKNWRDFEGDLESILIRKLGYSPSKKKLDTFKREFQTCYEIFVRDVIISLDKALNRSLEDYAPDFGGKGGVEILNPKEQVCSLWE